MKKLLFIDNTAHHLYTQRHLYMNFKNMGHEVILCCPDDSAYFKKLKNLGFNCLNLSIKGKGKNPLNDLLLLKKIHQLFKTIKPDIVFSFTIKPNIYSALVGKMCNVKVVPNVTGLGYVFMKRSLLTRFIVKLYKFAFSNLSHIVFQNSADKKIFIRKQILSPAAQVVQLPGSGVNLDKFPFVGYTNQVNDEDVFLYSGRLLRDKGLRELIAAFRIVKATYPKIKLKIIGNYFHANPSAISKRQLRAWQQELGIEYLGMVDNVHEVIAEADCIVLPSYREGMARAILEASSMGKPVIATNVTGCREAVSDGVTGFLCKVKDHNDLASKMLQFIRLEFTKKQEFGINGRKKMEREFDQSIVISKYMSIVQDLSGA